jgi:peptidoglycan/xylan/chitin deacetylase (PgdA/CDA1 family)
MSLSVLCYHSYRIEGDGEQTNDHVALANNLAALRQAGVDIVALSHVVACVTAQASWPSRPTVAITCDDGADLDIAPLPSDPHRVRGFAPILREFDARAVSFVIASPRTRAALAQALAIPDVGLGDDWWRAAQPLEIGSHGWSHNHDVAPDAHADALPRGSFLPISSGALALHEISRAQGAFRAHGVATPRYFAYPYGDVPPFLVDTFFPSDGEALGLHAAFSTEAKSVAPSDSRWAIPRLTCGRDWTSSDELLKRITEK